MKTLIENPKLTEQQLAEAAQQSAKHFLLCFKQDELDIFGTISLLLDCCIKHKEQAIHRGLLHYCQTFQA